MKYRTVTAKEASANLSYDPLTGLFAWRNAREGRQLGRAAGSLNKVSGYTTICINGRNFLAHRIAWLFVYGCMPCELDHINGRRSDNRIENLREVTRSQNCQNTDVPPKNNKTGIRGVFFDRAKNRYRTELRLNGKSVYHHRFKTLKEAAVARKRAERRYFGNFARG